MRYLVFLAAAMSQPAFSAETVEIIHERQPDQSDCYQIAVSGERTPASVTLGSSWAGHPLYIEGGGTLEITKVTPGWTATVNTKKKYGYRDIEITAPATFRHLKNIKGPVAAVCIATHGWPEGKAPDFSKLPYSVNFHDSGNRELGATARGPGKWATNMFLDELLKGTQDSADFEEVTQDARDVMKILGN